MGADFGLAPPRETPEPAHPQTTATDHIEVPPPCSCSADPLWRAEVGDQWSQPILAADWPPIDLPTASKAQLQEEGVLTPHERHTLSTQLG